MTLKKYKKRLILRMASGTCRRRRGVAGAVYLEIKVKKKRGN